MNNVIGLILIFIGVLFDIFGCVGLVRMPDVFNRLQAATKCATLGTWMIMFGIFVIAGLTGPGFKSLLCAVFVLLTSPVGAHAIARGAYRSGVMLWEKSIVDDYAASKKGKATSN